MITITNTKINISQGETGAITFFFKDYKTDTPIVVSPSGLESEIYIEFKVSDSAGAGEVVIDKIYPIYPFNKQSISDEASFMNDAVSYHTTLQDFYLFEDKNIIDYKNGDPIDKVNVLYRKRTKAGDIFFFSPDDSFSKLVIYDYKNSSLTIQFDKEDTENLTSQTYYYEITLIGKIPNGEYRENWVRPTEFIVLKAEV